SGPGQGEFADVTENADATSRSASAASAGVARAGRASETRGHRPAKPTVPFATSSTSAYGLRSLGSRTAYSHRPNACCSSANSQPASPCACAVRILAVGVDDAWLLPAERLAA